MKRLIRMAGFELQRVRTANTEDAILDALLRIVRPEVVLDVGANVGQYRQRLRNVGYKGLIISFEALPFLCNQLERSALSDPNWKIAPCAALGDVGGWADMNVSANTASSSLLAMREECSKAAPESRYVRKEQVQVMRLDDPRMSSQLPARGDVMLKIDAQGYEKKVIDGATGLLPRITALQIELSVVELYEGAPSMSGMLQQLSETGFQLFNLTHGFKDPASGRLLQLDGFFLRPATAEPA